MTELHEKTAELLMIIWRGIASDYKSRYRTSIWKQFEDQIRSAAYTNDFHRFLSTLMMKMSADFGTRAQDRERAMQLIAELAGHSREVLNILRRDTQLLVLMVRVANDQRRAEWEKLTQEEES